MLNTTTAVGLNDELQYNCHIHLNLLSINHYVLISFKLRLNFNREA